MAFFQAPALTEDSWKQLVDYYYQIKWWVNLEIYIYCPRNTFCPHLDRFVETDVRRRNVLNELLIVRYYFQSWCCYCDCLPLSQRVPEHIKTGKMSISWAVGCFQIRKSLAHRVERILVEPTNSLKTGSCVFYLIVAAAFRNSLF